VKAWFRVGLISALTVFVSTLAFSRVTVSNTGNWPDSWPEELERYRTQARTFGVGHGIQETVYEIHFHKRGEFEQAWPHILKLKSKGAPLILQKSPSTYNVSGSTAETGVRILCPSGGVLGLPDGTRLEAGPPWPESVRSPSGEIPEYVVPKEGNWVPFDGKELTTGIFLHRARIDIVLITDGKVVDLNRIPLPPDSPIIDRRFVK